MAANGTEHLDPGQAARCPLGLLPEESPERWRLRLCDDELHQRRRIEVDQGPLSFPGPCATENHDYFYGAKGRATIKGWDPLHEIEGESPWKYQGEGNDMYQQELDELMAAIREGKTIDNGTYMARSTMLGIMVRMAAYTGRVITWEEALASKERLGPESYSLGAVPVAALPIPGQTAFV